LKSGDMTKKTQSSFADDVWDVEQAGTMQNFVVGHEVVPADVQYVPFPSIRGRVNRIPAPESWG